MTLHVGVTGSRDGADPGQLAILSTRLGDLYNETPDGILVLHHGCCLGVDQQTHDIAWLRGYRIIGHPPTNKRYRANVQDGPHWTPGFDRMLDPKPYLERDVDIVTAVELLFVLPSGLERDQPRSGTWYTFRAAIARDVRTILIPPTEATA